MAVRTALAFSGALINIPLESKDKNKAEHEN
jgi:hypothetical protein